MSKASARARLGAALSRRRDEYARPPVEMPHHVAAGDGNVHVPRTLRVSADIAWRVIVIGVALWIVAQVFHATSVVVIPVAVGLLFAALMMPLTDGLARIGLPRYLAAAVTIVAFVGTIVGLLGVAGGELIRGFSDLRQSGEDGLRRIQDWLRDGPVGIEGRPLEDLLEDAQDWLSRNRGTVTSGALEAGSTASTLLAGAAIAMFVMFFFLADGGRIWRWHVRLLPRNAQVPVHESFRRGWLTIGSYVRAQMTLAGIDAIGIGLGAFALGLPLVVPLALVVFFASAVPIVGAFLSGALAVLVALVVKGPWVALIMLGIVIAVQQIESYLMAPIIMKKAVSLHPVATLLGVAVGSYAMGIPGAVFAVPLMAVINTVVLYLRGYDAFPDLPPDDTFPVSQVTDPPVEPAET